MRKSNWPNGWDLSHPNWTGKTPAQCKYPLRKQEKEPSVWVQIGLGILIATTFMVGMFAL
jgi:hypothetical protein